MNESPQLKLADNIPVTVVFLTLPIDAKEIPNKFDDSKPTHIYNLEVVTGATQTHHVWFATSVQHKELLQKNIMPETQYTLLKKKLASDKYPTFLVDKTFGFAKTEEKKIGKDPVVMGMALKKAIDICISRKDTNSKLIMESAKIIYEMYQQLMNE